LFLITAAGTETYDPSNYEPGKYPDYEAPTKRLSAEAVRKGLELERMKLNPF